MITIKIDWEKCTGCASCNVVYKEVFNYDDVKEKAFIPEGLTNIDSVKAMKAATECPAKAISIYDENGVIMFPKV